MIYGKYETVVININDISVLPQVRQRKNIKLEEMTESIKEEGLINSLDVTRLTKKEFIDHLSFVNKLWKKEVNINNFKTIDNHYYVLISGHTRLEALKLLQKQDKVDIQVVTKIHKVHTSEEIISLQLSENIHSEPRIEERAIAIIETYHIGLLNGKWNCKSEFRKIMQNRISARILNDALSFANLPADIQEYIFSGSTSYSVGVELGKIYPLLEEYYKETSGDLWHENLKLKYANLLLKISKSKSIKNSLSIIKGCVNTINDYYKDSEEVSQIMLEFLEDSPNRQALEMRKILINEYKNLKRDVSVGKVEQAIKLLAVDEEITGDNNSVEIDTLNNIKETYVKRKL